MYRWYVHDPIRFGTSLRWTIEHGHANNFANDYASVAYWYQEPLAALPQLGSAAEIALDLGPDYDSAYGTITAAATEARSRRAASTTLCGAADPLYRGDFVRAREDVTALDWFSG